MPFSFLAEPIAPVMPSLPQDKASLIRHLEKTNPEALALARDWEDTAFALTETQEKIEACVPSSPSSPGVVACALVFLTDDWLYRLETANPDALSLGMAHLHYRMFSYHQV